MKIIIFLLASFLMSFSSHASEVFVPGTADIPLMDGLKMNPVANMDFDTPAGQIMTINASGQKLTGKEVQAYYAAVLPQMGWSESQEGRFVRDKDSISITILKEKSPVIIRFETAVSNTAE